MTATRTATAELEHLQPSFARRLRALIADAPGPVGITSGFRSRADQQRLYDLYRSGKGNPANPPGKSRHERGEAADLSFRTNSVRAWCHTAAPRYGLRFPYRHEPWHIEPDSTPDPAPADDDEDELNMTPEQLRSIVRAEVDAAVALVIRGDKTHPDSIKNLRAEVAALRKQLAER